MSDAFPFPPRPNLNQYKQLARDLQRACKSTDAAAIRTWAARWIEALSRLLDRDTAATVSRHQIDRASERLERRWESFHKADERRARCLLADAQFFVAREHGFTSWPAFAAHLETLIRPESAVSSFEAAVDAIVAGDAATLRRLLRDHPSLVRARSTRDHQSTLLHYVSANGVEDFRQQTPQNIVELTRILLQAGADVNATSDAYGGGSTTLGLAATSLHPQQAGVQIALIETLLDHGAAIEQGAAGGAITGCLANGQPEAARFLASRGAALNLAGAAGLGRLDVVETFFDEYGALQSGASKEQLELGFLYACGYNHLEVVRVLLQRGVDPDTRNGGGETGLHWASFGPSPAIAKLLLQRGAAVDVRDDHYKATPLEWALFAWSKSEGASRDLGYQLAAVLVQSGAKVDIPSLEPGAAEQARADPRMQQILRAP